MKPHKHAELIKAWADGAAIEYRWTGTEKWEDCVYPQWHEEAEYRIKHQPKPDRYKCYLALEGRIYSEGDSHPFAASGYVMPNLQLTFDGETGELKSAEVLK